MLAVQVQYWALEETKKHNRATEQETAQHNRETEKISWSTLDEQIKHNRAQEDYWNASLEEQRRHAMVTEAQDWEKVAQGWENVAIGQQNAQSNATQAAAAASQAYTAERNADIRFEELQNAITDTQTRQQQADTQYRKVEYDYDLGMRAAETNQYNAETNRLRQSTDAALGYENLDVSVQGLELRRQMFQLDSDKFAHQKVNDYFNNTLTGAKATESVVNSGLNVWNAVNGW